ncbi:hypothetical protein ABTY20_33655 [Streptomyces sp. NPDC126497]|uniref:hypothetical protein n=1 Tax=Streptomyces sp. NPDC126497 TaxID=3155313 RepID=UPI00333215BE
MRTAGREGTGRARLALPALAAGVLVPLVAAGLRSVLRALLGLAGPALAAVGLWWTLAHSGAVRTAGAVRTRWGSGAPDRPRVVRLALGRREDGP